jgi:hypothetical protein
LQGIFRCCQLEMINRLRRLESLVLLVRLGGLARVVDPG